MGRKPAPDLNEVLTVMAQATKKVQEALSQHRYLTLREKEGQRIMEILAGPGQPGALTLAAEPDGTITATMNGEPHPEVKLNPTAGETRGLANNAVATLIMEETLAALADGPIDPETLWSEASRNQLERDAVGIIREAERRSSTPDWYNTGRTAGKELDTKHIAETLLGRYENWLLLERMNGKNYEGHSVAEYNIVARNSATFRRMEERESPPLHFYCNRIAPTEPEPRTFEHPGEVIRVVKETLELPGELWKVFANIPHPAWPRGPEVNRKTVTKVCTILASGNAPLRDRESVKTMVTLLARPDTNYNVRWNHGSPTAAWGALAREFLSMEITRHSFHTSSPEALLPRIADALRGRINDDHPWGRGNWETLARRAERWHREKTINARRAREAEIESMADRGWNSALESVELEEFTFTAVTNGRALVKLSDTMENCLYTFVNDCAGGHCRIFTAHRNNELEAALEIYLQDGHWLPGQAEGSQHQRPPKGLAKLHQKLCAIYEDRYKRTEVDVNTQC